jgi:hypothetical protein
MLEQNWWQTASLCTSSSYLHTSCLPLVQSYFSALIHVQCADQYFLSPLSVSFTICIHLVHFTLSEAFCQSVKQAQISPPISKVRSDVFSTSIVSLVSFPLLNPNWFSRKYSLNFHFSSPSQYPYHYLFSVCAEADCAMVAAFCSFWLLF